MRARSRFTPPLPGTQTIEPIPLSSAVPEPGRASFARHCPRCPRCGRCTTATRGRTIQVHPHEHELRAARRRATRGRPCGRRAPRPGRCRPGGPGTTPPGTGSGGRWPGRGWPPRRRPRWALARPRSPRRRAQKQLHRGRWAAGRHAWPISAPRPAVTAGGQQRGGHPGELGGVVAGDQQGQDELSGQVSGIAVPCLRPRRPRVKIAAG